MQTRILIIDDDVQLQKLISIALKSNEYQVHLAYSPTEGLKAIYAEQPDLVILDIMLPEMDGWQVCKRIRDMCDVPILMLTALNQEDDMVKGLDLGADDYLVKPFVPSELVARVKALLRRSYGNKPIAMADQVIQFNDLVIDLDKSQVIYKAEPVRLTPTEFKLLVCMTRHRGRVLPHDFLLKQVWGAGYEDNIHILRMYVKKVRNKLMKIDKADEDLIRSEWGIGYRLG